MVEVMSKHLNVAHIYIHGKGYIIENHGKEINKVVESLEQIEKRDQSVVNKKVEQAIRSN